MEKGFGVQILVSIFFYLRINSERIFPRKKLMNLYWKLSSNIIKSRRKYYPPNLKNFSAQNIFRSFPNTL